MSRANDSAPESFFYILDIVTTYQHTTAPEDQEKAYISMFYSIFLYL